MGTRSQGTPPGLTSYRARFTPTAFLFHKKAIVKLEVPKEQSTSAIEKLWDLAIEVGAEDIVDLSEMAEKDASEAATRESSVVEVEVRVYNYVRAED
jgi:transcriptional/translational regulatory protein YebC/TACO1